MCYVNIMTFESILGVFCSEQVHVYFKELKIKLNFLNYNMVLQRSHSEACTQPYTCFVFNSLE